MEKNWCNMAKHNNVDSACDLRVPKQISTGIWEVKEWEGHSVIALFLHSSPKHPLPPELWIKE